MANTLLKIEHLTKSYDGNVILKDFNLSVGTEVELSNNFALFDGFYAIPTLAVKWEF